MLAKRVIPCLDVDRGRVVKGTNFVNLRDAGDPVQVAARYEMEGADELVFLDITASHEERENNGISHFLEHLLWNPRHLPEPARRRLYRLVEAGARYEAFTSKEYSRFMVTCLPERFGLALEVAAAALRERTLDAAAVEEERGVLLHEHAMTFASSSSWATCSDPHGSADTPASRASSSQRSRLCSARW